MRFDKGDAIIKSEIGHPRFGNMTTFGSSTTRDCGEITDFADLGYDEREDMTVRIDTGEVYSPYPDDYRARPTFLRGRL